MCVCVCVCVCARVCARVCVHAYARRAKVTYPNGDTYEGGFNEAKQKHGRGVYIWSCAVGANAWVPEEGFPEGAAPIVRYDGQYLDGKKHGIGKLLMPDGDKYHGMLLDTCARMQ
ncbi:hypothetical protein EON67_04165 [archaeon]|nr:MAG: hypothetical protein EON67_04165 [archaeon]